MDCHDIRFIESLRTIRALPHTIGDTVFNAMVAERVAACLDSSVLEVLAANGAKSKSLLLLVKIYIDMIGTYPKHFFLARLVA